MINREVINDISYSRIEEIKKQQSDEMTHVEIEVITEKTHHKVLIDIVVYLEGAINTSCIHDYNYEEEQVTLLECGRVYPPEDDIEVDRHLWDWVNDHRNTECERILKWYCRKIERMQQADTVIRKKAS